VRHSRAEHAQRPRCGRYTRPATWRIGDRGGCEICRPSRSRRLQRAPSRGAGGRAGLPAGATAVDTPPVEPGLYEGVGDIWVPPWSLGGRWGQGTTGALIRS
jgi:hypothetical protein